MCNHGLFINKAGRAKVDSMARVKNTTVAMTTGGMVAGSKATATDVDFVRVNASPKCIRLSQGLKHNQ